MRSNLFFVTKICSLTLLLGIFLNPGISHASDLEKAFNNVGGLSSVEIAKMGSLGDTARKALNLIAEHSNLLTMVRTELVALKKEYDAIVHRLDFDIALTTSTRNDLIADLNRRRQELAALAAQETDLIQKIRWQQSIKIAAESQVNAIQNKAGLRTVESAGVLNKAGKFIASALRNGSRLAVVGTAMGIGSQLYAGNYSGAAQSSAEFMITKNPVGAAASYMGSVKPEMTEHQRMMSELRKKADEDFLKWSNAHQESVAPPEIFKNAMRKWEYKYINYPGVSVGYMQSQGVSTEIESYNSAADLTEAWFPPQIIGN